MSYQAALTAGALFVTVACSALGVPNTLHRPAWQPKGGAFSIWGVIYVSLAITSWLLRDAPRTDYTFAGLLSASLLCCAAWIVAIRYASIPLATFLICIASVFATCAVATMHIQSDQWREWVLGIGPGLLAGWLGLASALGVNLLYYERTGRDLEPWTLLLGALPAACVSIVARTPSTGACIVWGAAWLPVAAGWVQVVAVLAGLAIAAGSVVAARL